MAGKKGIKTYPVEVKLETVRLFCKDGKTRAEITKALGLPSEERLSPILGINRALRIGVPTYGGKQ